MCKNCNYLMSVMSGLICAHVWLLPYMRKGSFYLHSHFSAYFRSDRTDTQKNKMRILISLCALVCLLGLCVEAFPQKKKDLDKKFFREGKSDLLQGCTPQQLLDLDQENIACYKRVKITCFNKNIGGVYKGTKLQMVCIEIWRP